jgi:sugar/nucleoside kinase (ribokinase family)
MPELPHPLAIDRAVHTDCGDFTRLLCSLNDFDSKRKTPQDFLSERAKEPGGSVLNALKAARLFGVEAYFGGSCGASSARDEDAQFFQSACAHRGISCSLATRQEASGRCLVVRAGKGRARGFAVAASPGSAPFVQPEQFNETFAQKADCIFIEGMLCGNAELMERVTFFCARHKTPLALLCATPDGAQKTAALLADEFSFDIFVFANKREGEIAAEKARNANNAVYVETDGKKGGAVWLRCGKKNTRPFRFRAAKPMRPVVDPTGAGDVFAGTFLALWFLNAQKNDPLETLDEKQTAARLQHICRTAVKLAAHVTTVPLCKVDERWLGKR